MKYLETVNNENKKNKRTRTTEIRKKLFLEQYEKYFAMPVMTCKSIGIHPETYYRWRASDEKFNKECENIEMGCVEKVKGKLLELVQQNNLGAIIFYLCNKSKGEFVNIQKIEHKADEGTLKSLSETVSRIKKLLTSTDENEKVIENE